MLIFLFVAFRRLFNIIGAVMTNFFATPYLTAMASFMVLIAQMVSLM